MRYDMSNVLTEARAAGDRMSGRPRSLPRMGLEDLPSREKMRSCANKASALWRHQPLLRFLEARIGRQWNVVHSEICAGNSMSNYAQRSTRILIERWVTIAITMVGSTPYSNQGPLSGGSFWVDPNDGILKMVPRERRKPTRRARQTFRQVRIDQTNRYVLINGGWFLVKFAALVSEDCGDQLNKDVVLQLPLSAGREACRQEWQEDVYACYKQQLGGARLKRLKREGVLPA